MYMTITAQPFEMSVNQFSADRDHETMTWGTLDPVKILKVLTQNYTLFVYHIRLEEYFPFDVFHMGSHTLEHYLAYSWGIRDQIKSISQTLWLWIDSKSILDISPEKRGENYSIKISTLSDFWDGKILLDATQKALELIKPLLIDGSEIPFANARQCGQYTYHNKKAALGIIEHSSLALEVEPKDFSGKQYINVCDFRQLKPKLSTEDNQYFLDPDVSHTLGNYIDTHWKSLSMTDIEVSIGVYGCMTGQYVIIASEQEIDKKILDRVHGGLIKLILNCARENVIWKRMQDDVEQMISLVEKYNHQRLT